MNQVSARVISNERILGEFKRSLTSGGRDVSGSWLMWMEAPDIASKTSPGQFIMVRCEDCTLPRPFSIHRVDKDGNLAIFYAVWEDGRGTQWLSERRPGNKIDIFGPLGNGFTLNKDSYNLLLIAGGVGIAPIHFLAEQSLNEGRSVTLLYGTANNSRYPIGLPIRPVDATEDGSVGYKGMLTELLPNFVSEADQIFACGPIAMYRDMASSYAHLLKDKPVQVSLEVRMGCGYGVCYGCTVKTINGLKQVCKDGPVFNLEYILWEEPIC